MTELTFPSFPARTLAVIAAALAALVPVGIVLNASAPSRPGTHACAVAAARVMAAQDYQVAMMELIGPGAVRACHGLSRQRYAQALADTYRIQYGGKLPAVPPPRDVPPPAFKALSARAAAQSH